MKSILFAVALLPLCASAQMKKHTHYLASNGIDYKQGDTIKLGRGSDYNGDYRYLYEFSVGGIFAGTAGRHPGATNSGYNVILTKIKSHTERGATKMLFYVNLSGFNHILEIEDAIATCEILPCNKTMSTGISTADELAKLKKLKDDGIITEEEFQAQKAKLLK